MNTLDKASPAVVKRLVLQAKRLYEKFTGHRTPRDAIKIVNQSDVVVEIGHIDAILYTTKRDGVTEKYFHRFPDRPVLAISSDGMQAYILAGEYKFTARGFTP